jgi:nicotinamidase-related amidase
MTTLEGRVNSGLLIIDVQNGVVAQAHDRDRVIENINLLVESARDADVPVIWVQHRSEELPPESYAWRYVPELAQRDDEPVVHKEYGDSFEATELEAVLAERGIGQLFVAGAQTDACIRSTLHGALVRGYDTVLVADAHTTEDLSAYGAPPPAQVIAHTNLYWEFQTAPGRSAGVVNAAEVEWARS